MTHINRIKKSAVYSLHQHRWDWWCADMRREMCINTDVQVGFDTLRRRRSENVLHFLSEIDNARNDGRQINCWAAYRHSRPTGTTRVVVSVSTSRSQDGLETYQRLEKNCQRLGLVSVSWGRRLVLLSVSAIYVSCPRPILGQIVVGHSTQCERALDVVSLCCSSIAHHINTLKQWTWKITSTPVIAINKTCTLTSRSRLESYKRLVSVSSRLVKPTSWSRLGLVLVSSFYVSYPPLGTTDSLTYTVSQKKTW